MERILLTPITLITLIDGWTKWIVHETKVLKIDLPLLVESIKSRTEWGINPNCQLDRPCIQTNKNLPKQKKWLNRGYHKQEELMTAHVLLPKHLNNDIL